MLEPRADPREARTKMGLIYFEKGQLERAATEFSLVLAAAPDEKPVKGERIATAQAIPLRFLENILMQLRHAGLVESRRGAEGGYRLARPAAEVTLADVIRAIDGPLAGVSGSRPETLDFTGVESPFGTGLVTLRSANSTGTVPPARTATLRVTATTSPFRSYSTVKR